MKSILTLIGAFLVTSGVFAAEMPKKVTCLEQTSHGTRIAVLEASKQPGKFEFTVSFATNDPNPKDHVYNRDEIYVNNLSCEAPALNPLVTLCGTVPGKHSLAVLATGFDVVGKLSELHLDRESGANLDNEGLLLALDREQDSLVEASVAMTCAVAK